MTTEKGRRSDFADRIVVSHTLAELRQSRQLAPGQQGRAATGDSPAVLRQNSAPASFLACGWRSWGRACVRLGVAESAAKKKTEMPPRHARLGGSRQPLSGFWGVEPAGEGGGPR